MDDTEAQAEWARWCRLAGQPTDDEEVGASYAQMVERILTTHLGPDPMTIPFHAW